jgi:hypothetical protein
MDSTASPAAPETISATLRLILRGLLAALGGFGLEPMQGVVLYGRINAAFGRIERMLVRFRAGRLWRRTAQTTMQRRRGRAAGRGPALPRRFGWLVKVGGYRAAGFGSQLQTVLSTPEMAEMLAAAPQAGRILRPLCRALAIEMPGVFERPRKPAGARATIKRRPRPKPEPFRIPLPRGVISAARRAGFRGIDY